jgi:hypothetical protein
VNFNSGGLHALKGYITKPCFVVSCNKESDIKPSRKNIPLVLYFLFWI